MAALSVAAYGKDNRSAQGSINYQNTSHDNVLSGWSAITFDIPQSGTYWDDRNFYNVSNAELMVAVNGNTLAVAFRGSQAEDFDENTETWGEPLRDDWYSARFGLTAYVENFEPFLQGLNAYLQENQNIDTLWLTGHSLGGATAETYAASFANDAAFFNIRSPLTVTFGSPGTNLITNSSITNLYHIDHTGDPVSNNILINHSFEGMQIEIDLPNTNGGLVNVWPPDVVAEHLSQLYSDNISEIVGSVLYENTSSSTVLRVAEQASDDTVAGLNTQEDELILGLSGDDTFWEGRRGVGSVDYIDGGDGTDVLDFSTRWNSLPQDEALFFHFGATQSESLAGILSGSTSTIFTSIEKVVGSTYSDVYYVDLDIYDPDRLPNLVISDPAGTDDWFGFVGAEFFNNDYMFEQSGTDLTVTLFESDGSTVAGRLTVENHFGTGSIENAVIWDDAFNELAVFGFAELVDNSSTGNVIRAGSIADECLANGSGTDVNFGGGGNDKLEGGHGGGDDRLDGGDGNDTVTFTSTSLGVTVNLSTGTATGAETGTDVLRRIENVVGGSGDDTITGDANANVLDGGSGNDTLTGGGGNDVFIVDSLGDTVVEAADGGFDIIRTSLTNLTLADNVERIEILGTWGGSRTLNGNAGNNWIVGGTGSDTMDGGDGDDELEGGDGHDWILAGVGNDIVRGGNHTDNMWGGAGDDDLYGDDGLSGNAGNDRLWGGNGSDLLFGQEGADFLDGGSGVDHLHGWTGNDVLLGGAGRDVMHGDQNNDHLEGGSGDAFMYGGTEHDHLFGQDGADQMFGGSGNDTLHGWTGNDTLFGEHGDDVLYGDQNNDGLSGGAGNDRLYGGSEDDQLFGQSGNDRLDGGTGHDNLYGWTGEDTLLGGDGHDTLRGDQNNDLLFGGNGNDTLYGGSEHDQLYGEAGDDVMHGEGGFDGLSGGAGNDQLFGGSGGDQLFGQTGDDALDGGAGHDRLHGWTGNDTLIGDDGNDTLYGDQNDDRLEGGSGNDRLYGGSEHDTLLGQDGNDTLDGGTGNDILTGGDGDDLFVFANGAGRDRVEDFTAGAGTDDRLDLRNVTSINDMADLLAASTQDGADTVIDLGGPNELTLIGVDRSTLHQDDFLF